MIFFFSICEPGLPTTLPSHPHQVPMCMWVSEALCSSHLVFFRSHYISMMWFWKVLTRLPERNISSPCCFFKDSLALGRFPNKCLEFLKQCGRSFYWHWIKCINDVRISMLTVFSSHSFKCMKDFCIFSELPLCF